jgi:hypothetical protein
MPPRFLPRTIHDYAIPYATPHDFTAGGPELMDDIGRKMSVDRASSEGRIPSPYSRGFVFATNLFGKGLRPPESGDAPVTLDRGREMLQADARAAFRGVCAAFALRRALGLEIRFLQVPLADGADAVQRVLVETSHAAPRGGLWWNPLRLFTIRQSELVDAEVFAGLSPVSAVYPAARKLRRMRALFWYDVENGRWLDPTAADGDDPVVARLNPLTRATLVRLLRAWTTQAAASLQNASSMDPFGLLPGEVVALRRELETWRDQLGGAVSTQDLVEPERLGAREGEVPPFLELVCTPAASEVLSDFPFFDGQLLVARDALSSVQTRIFGRVFGHSGLAERAALLQAGGDNLGRDLGLGADAIPVAYRIVDRLFTPRLLPLTERGLSPEWEGLSIAGTAYLYPFSPSVLDLVPPRELARVVAAEWDRKHESVLVRLQLGGREITQIYFATGMGEYQLDADLALDQLDVRLFPNFDLDTVGRALDPELVEPEMRQYFARVRVPPEWPLSVTPFRYDHAAGRLSADTGTHVRVGADSWHGNNEVYHPGQHLVYTLDWKPTGFSMEGRGICLLHLPGAEEQPSQWDVGVDFGTSNTCVTCRTDADAEPRILRLPVLTTTLLRIPDYSAEFGGARGVAYNEGGAAMVDFFHRRNVNDTFLTSGDFFPTQLATRFVEPQDRWRWAHEGGLIQFENLGRADPNVWELIRPFPADGVPRGRKLGQPFHLRQDIKWENARWLRLFMQHLRRQVVLTAARHRAALRSLSFSYPKAFSLDQRDHFKQVLREVWKPSSRLVLNTLSESEAVRNYVVRGAQGYVVFDIGGGTSDLIGFNVGIPVFQTSFKVAAGKINEYVARSVAFRRAFRDAFREEFGRDQPFVSAQILENFALPYTDAVRELLSTIWLALLEAIEGQDPSGRRLLNILGTLRRLTGDLEDPGVRAVKGFFTSIVLLIGGLGYVSGLLLRAASEGMLGDKPFNLRTAEVLLTGNGSKLYNLIDHEEAPFRPVLQRMVLAGLAAADAEPATSFSPEDMRRVTFDGLYRLNGRPAPKVTVAMGLLRAGTAGRNGGDRVPLANIMAEEGYAVGGATAAVGDSLITFYRQVREELQVFSPPAEAPEHLRRLLDALGSALPNGINGGLAVIPRAGSNWHVPLRDTLYRRSEKYILNRIMQNANTLSDELGNNRFSEDEIPALEPLLVTEVCALLDQIREDYA